MRNFIFLSLLILSGCCYTSTAYIRPSDGPETIVGPIASRKAPITFSTSMTSPFGSPVPAKLTPKQIAKAKKIIITEMDISDREYKILADIEVKIDKTCIFCGDPTSKEVNKELRKEAAKIGADAVILVRYGTVGITFENFGGTLNGKGRAVVFVD